MPSKYHYLLASLPYLHSSEKPPLTTAGLRERFAVECDEADMGALFAGIARLTGGKKKAHTHTDKIAPSPGAVPASAGATDDSEPDEAVRNSLQSFVLEWEGFIGGLRGEIARMRAQNHNSDIEVEWPYLESAHIISRVKEIVDGLDPLGGERGLIELQWEALHEYTNREDTSDIQRLLIYYLQLSLCERNALFTIERAEENLETMYGGMRGRINNLVHESMG